MRILALADEPVNRLWSEYGKETLQSVDLILSCGDLPAAYLNYITCFSSAPVVYVHGNHDTAYEKKPPEGCVCADGHVVLVGGLRILGLGGSIRYRPGPCMYSEEEMARRIRRLRREIRSAGGFDILLTHSPIAGVGDQEDPAHRGFECFKPLLNRYRPAVMFHGHVHQGYTGHRFTREREFGGIPVINACGSFEYDFPADWAPAGSPTRMGRFFLERRSVPGREVIW